MTDFRRSNAACSVLERFALLGGVSVAETECFIGDFRDRS